MKTHSLKCHPEPFRDLRSGIKTMELRFDDRGYERGDTLIIKEWKPRKKYFTGHELRFQVSLITRIARWIPAGIDYRWVILSLREICD